MPVTPDGFSAALAAIAVDKRIRPAISHRSILKPPMLFHRSLPAAAPRSSAAVIRQSRRRVEYGQPAVKLKLTNFNVSARRFAAIRRSEQASDAASKPALGRRRTGVAGSGHEGITVLIPFAPRIIIAEHRRIGLGLIGESKCEVALDEALQRLWDMRRRLIIVDHAFEAVHRRQILAPRQVITADLHLLAGQMVAGEIELELGVPRIFAVGKTTHHIVERLQGKLGGLLIAADI